MRMSYFGTEFLAFFRDLDANNSSEWFQANKKRYEKDVKAPFNSFVQDLILRVRELEPDVLIEPKDSIARINRDTRFSKDKSPYRTYMYAIVSPGGRKDKTSPGLYVNTGPKSFFLAGGAYMLEPAQLHAVRSAIAADPEGFESLINDSDFKSKWSGIQGEANKKLPPEFVEPAKRQPLIANKQFFFMTELPAETIERDDLLDFVSEYHRAGLKVNEFFREALRS